MKVGDIIKPKFSIVSLTREPDWSLSSTSEPPCARFMRDSIGIVTNSLLGEDGVEYIQVLGSFGLGWREKIFFERVNL